MTQNFKHTKRFVKKQDLHDSKQDWNDYFNAAFAD